MENYCCYCGKAGASFLCSETKALVYCSSTCELKCNESGIHHMAKLAIARAEQAYAIGNLSEEEKTSNEKQEISFDLDKSQLTMFVKLSDISQVIAKYSDKLHVTPELMCQIDQHIHEHFATSKELVDCPYLVELCILRKESTSIPREYRHDQEMMKNFFIVQNSDFDEVQDLEDEIRSLSVETPYKVPNRITNYALKIKRPRFWWNPPPKPAKNVNMSNVVAWNYYYNEYWPWFKYWSFSSLSQTFEKTEEWYKQYYS